MAQWLGCWACNLGPVVYRGGSTIQRINHYPEDKLLQNVKCY